MKVLVGSLVILSSLFAQAATSLEGTWKGPVFRCASGESPKLYGIAQSQTVTFADSTLSYEFSVTINGQVCNISGTSSYEFTNGILHADGKTISETGPGCVGSATLESSQTAVEIEGNELRQTMPGPNESCSQAGDSLISVLIKQ